MEKAPKPRTPKFNKHEVNYLLIIQEDAEVGLAFKRDICLQATDTCIELCGTQLIKPFPTSSTQCLTNCAQSYADAKLVITEYFTGNPRVIPEPEEPKTKKQRDIEEEFKDPPYDSSQFRRHQK